MGFNISQQVYGQTAGTTSTGGVWVDIRDPTSADVGNPWKIGQFWLNTAATALWYLNNFTSTSGYIQANWIDLSSAAGAITITGDSGGGLTGTSFTLTGGATGLTFAGTSSPATETISGILNLANGGTGVNLTSVNNAVWITSATGVPEFLANSGTAGYVLTANTGAPPSWQAAGGGGGISTITGNSGGAESPLAGNFNILGTGSITVAGSANTETVQLTGLTNHALQIGAGTATLTQLGPGTTGQVLQTNTTANPTWSTATYPSTTTVSQLLYSSSANTVSGLATGNDGVLITSNTGVPSWLANSGTAGYVLTANTGAPPSWQAAASSSNLTITSVAHAASPYTVLTTDQFLACQTSGGTISILLPNSPAIGRVIIVKDSNGAASTSNITITTVSGSINIDGQTSVSILSNYGSLNLVWDGSAYEIY